MCHIVILTLIDFRHSPRIWIFSLRMGGGDQNMW